MRILSVGNFGLGWDGSVCDEEHIATALEQLGHTVSRLQRESQWTITDDFDFTLISQWDGYNDISQLPKPLVYWAFDYQADGQEWHENLIRHADLYLSKRIADSKYPRWQWLSQDFSPQFLEPYPHSVKKDIDVLFTGSYLDWATERNETIKAVNQTFQLVVHSVNDWPFLERRPPVMDQGLPELYARAKVILSIDHTLEAGYWSDRNAQILSCGRRPLFRYVPLAETVFHNDVDYFYGIEDCLNRIDLKLSTGREKLTEDTDKYKVKARVQDLITIVKSVL